MSMLWPPLTWLENELFTPSDALIQRWRAGDALPVDLKRALETDPEAHARRDALDTAVVDHALLEEAPVPPLPPDLRALIRQRVASRTAAFSPIPKPGQIVRIDEVRGPQGALHWDLSRPLAVLLNAPTETPQVWYGWLVTAEVDYASDGDWLLGAEDQPCDPLARMVQLWNPVHVYLPSISRVLAELRPERLAAVRALAAAFVTEPPSDSAQAQPGRIVRRTVGDYAVRTGTPLGGADDPRHRYQQLYHAYAEAVREPAAQAVTQTAPSGNQGWLQSLADTLSRWFEPYQPIAHAMGVVTRSETWHYQVPDWLRLTLTTTVDDLALLRLEILSAESLQVQVLDADEIVQTARLDHDQPVVELRLDPAEPRLLVIGDADQPERYRIPLFMEDA